MPAVMVEVRRQYTREQEATLMEAIHSALVQAFKIPDHDRTARLVVHEPHRLVCAPGLTTPEFFTLVTIDAFAGRSLDAKRALYRAIVTNLESLGIPKDHVTIVLNELPKENWGIRGGQAGSDVAMGFKIEV